MEDETEGIAPERSGRSRLLGSAVMVAVALAAGVAIYGDRHTFTDALHRVGVTAVLASFVVGLAGVAATFPVWREVLAGLDVDLPAKTAARVFFSSQLGKYVPGAVWPIVLQVEAGRRHGAARRTMLTAGAFSLVIGVSTGILVACLLLPLADAHALSRYWFALLAVPVLLVLLHPRTLPLAVDRAMRVLRRPPLRERLRARQEVRACGWSVLSWLGLGGQLTLLCDGLGKGGLSTFVLCVGAMGLAVALGVLFIPAPAGAGVREVVLVLALGALLHPGEALAVVVASRALLVAADVALAVVAVVVTGRQPAPAR